MLLQSRGDIVVRLDGRSIFDGILEDLVDRLEGNWPPPAPQVEVVFALIGPDGTASMHRVPVDVSARVEYPIPILTYAVAITAQTRMNTAAEIGTP